MNQPPESVKSTTMASPLSHSPETGEDEGCSERARTWCQWQYAVLPDVRSLMLFKVASDSGLCTDNTSWPAGAPHAALQPLADKAAKQKKCLSSCVRDKEGGDEGLCLAIPLPVDAPEFVALVLSNPSAKGSQQAIRQLVEWGSYWLLQPSAVAPTVGNQDAAQALAQTVALHESVQAGCEELVAQIADTLDCECVSVGFVRRQKIQCRAVSDAPKFDGKMSLINAIESAMEESIDQQCSVGTTLDQTLISRGHKYLRSITGGRECYTVPVRLKGKILGAITVMGATEESTAGGAAWLEHVAAATAPVLNLQLLEDRSVIQRAGLRALETWRSFSGREHTGRQLVAMSVLVLFVFSLLLSGTHRVAARASLEGSDNQLITAPITGFVLEAGARAGDTVQQGEVIARLDDRELLVKQRQWLAELDKLEKAYAQALAESNRTELSLLRAQRDELGAELDLVEQQLARSVIKAPFSGVLVAGDLSQQLGAPVAAGETLFEITSLDSWRLLVDVDEHAVADIETGQTGYLRLASMPNHSYAMTVREIMPVALSREGETVFRLEATVTEQDERLRPGMQGVAKIDVGRSPYLWLWTHRLVKRIRIWLWSLGL